MPYRVRIVNTATRERTMEAVPISGGWGTARNDGRSGRMTVQLMDPQGIEDLQRIQLWPWQRIVVVEWAPTDTWAYLAVYAGFITKATYQWKTKQLSIDHTDIWKMFDKRFVLSDRTTDLASKKIIWTNLSPGTMAKKAIQAGTAAGTGTIKYDLPIVYPSDASGSIDRTVYGYNVESVRDLLDEVIESEGGPDIAFRPRYTSDNKLEWVMEVDANKSMVFDYDLDAADTPVDDMTFIVDGSDIANTVYGLGEGSEKKMLVRTSAHADSPYPALEDVVSFKEISKLATLQKRAGGHRAAHDGAIRQIQLDVLADGPPQLTQLRLGAQIRWKADSDPWLLNGWGTNWELIEIGGNLATEIVSLSFQSIEGRAGD